MQKKDKMPVLEETFQVAGEGIVLPEPFMQLSEEAIHCPVIVLRSDQLGQDSPELGKALLHELLQALLNHPEPPESILLYHKAVLLAVGESEFLPELKNLAGKGSEILSCRTSLEHLAASGPAVGYEVSLAGILERIRQARQVFWF